MTKVVSLVRLVPARHSNVQEDRAAVYIAEYKLPALGEKWVEVGTLRIGRKEFWWTPDPDHVDHFSDIDVMSHDLYAIAEARFNPELFARYKIRKFAKEIMEEKWPLGEVIPPILSG